MPSYTHRFSAEAEAEMQAAVDYANTQGGPPRSIKDWSAIAFQNWCVAMLVRKQKDTDAVDQDTVRDAAVTKVRIT